MSGAGWVLLCTVLYSMVLYSTLTVFAHGYGLGLDWAVVIVGRQSSFCKCLG